MLSYTRFDGDSGACLVTYDVRCNTNTTIITNEDKSNLNMMKIFTV